MFSSLLRHGLAAFSVLGFSLLIAGASQLPPPTDDHIKERDRIITEWLQLPPDERNTRKLPVMERVLYLERQAYGENDPRTLNRAETLARAYEEAVRLKEALELRKSLYENTKARFGPDHWKTRDKWLTYDDLRRTAEFNAAQLQTLADATEALALARQCFQEGNFRDGFPAADVAIKLRNELGWKEHPLIALAMAHQAGCLFGSGFFRAAEAKATEALLHAQQVFGPKHPGQAMVMQTIAVCHLNVGDYTGAEPWLRKCWELKRVAFADDLLELGQVWEDEALFAARRQDLTAAVAAVNNALDNYRRTVTERHMLYAAALSNLGQFHSDRGNHAAAETTLRQALGILQSQAGQTDPTFAACLQNLALVLQARGEYATAEAILRQSGNTLLNSVGNLHPTYQTSLHQLARVLLDQGEVDRAVEFLELARKLRADSGLASTLLYAETLADQAVAAHRKQDVNGTRQTLEVARQTALGAAGDRHLDLVRHAINQALFNTSASDFGRAAPGFREALGILENLALDQADLLPEPQRLRRQFLWQLALDGYLSTTSREGAELTALVNHILAWKDTLHPPGSALRTEVPADRVKDYEPYHVARRRLLDLALGAPTPAWNRARTELMREIDAEVAPVERAWQRILPRHRDAARRRRFGATELNQVLAPDAALFEFLEYHHFTPSATRKGPLRVERRLLAVVCKRGQPPVVIPYPTYEPIEKAVGAWHAARQRGDGAALTKAGVDISRWLWLPMIPYLNGVKTIWVAPEGIVRHVPWLALPGREPGGYLFEDFRFGWLTSGRQLMPTTTPRAADGDLVLLDLSGEDEAKAWLEGTPVAKAPQVKLSADATPRPPPDTAAARRWWVALAPVSEGEARITALHAAQRTPLYVALNREDQKDLERALLAALRRTDLAVRLAPLGIDDVWGRVDVSAWPGHGVDIAYVFAGGERGPQQTDAGDVVALARGFEQAGVRSLVVNQWPPDPVADRWLMQTMQRLERDQKLPKGEAHAQAVQELIKNPQSLAAARKALGIAGGWPEVGPGGKTNPVYWAGYTLWGARD